MDLIEDIRKVDAMILLHKGTAQDSLLIDQYEARKTKLMGQLIDELVSPEIQSPQSFSLVQKIISKFYPSASQPDALDGDIKRLAEAI
ncbi:hypothetical protein [Parapedobacter indicus]|nr:hypothetical protein [Parapedobacter indicus]